MDARVRARSLACTGCIDLPAGCRWAKVWGTAHNTRAAEPARHGWVTPAGIPEDRDEIHTPKSVRRLVAEDACPKQEISPTPGPDNPLSTDPFPVSVSVFTIGRPMSIWPLPVRVRVADFA